MPFQPIGHSEEGQPNPSFVTGHESFGLQHDSFSRKGFFDPVTGWTTPPTRSTKDEACFAFVHAPRPLYPHYPADGRLGRVRFRNNPHDLPWSKANFRANS